MSKTADNPTGPAFVVFGIGADHKPRAARFDDSQPKLVAKAAELMHLKLCEINSPALADLAKRLPVGRLYANGNGFVPPVRKQLYATLAATVAAASRNAATNGAPRSPGCRPAGTRSLRAIWSSPTKGLARVGGKRLLCKSMATCSPCTGATIPGSPISFSIGRTSR
jgi:hypothetical protein